MELFRFLRRKRLEPAWAYNAAGVLWQIHHGSPSALVGESREMGEKTVSFFCLDRETGEPYWENLNPADRWWSGIEAVHEEVVLIHGFASPDMPIHKGITAIDLRSGKTLWSRSEVRFSGLRGPALTVVADGSDSTSELVLDPRSGTTLEKAGGDGSPRMTPVPAIFPVRVDPERYPAGASFLPAQVVPDSVVMLEAEGVEVWGYCTAGRDEDRPSFRSELAVVEKETESERYRDTVSGNTSAVSSDQFFVQERTLYYVKDRSRLIAVPLRDR